MPKLTKVFAALLAVLMFAACAPKNPKTEPDWIVYGDYVGHARQTASKNLTEQKMLAIDRALKLLLRRALQLGGDGYISSDMQHAQSGSSEELYEVTQVKIDGEVKVLPRAVKIRVKNVWRNPRSKELYVQIEETD